MLDGEELVVREAHFAHSIGGDAAAREYYQQALAIQEKNAPNSLDIAMNLGNLGNLEGEHGDPKIAEEYLQRAAAIFEKLSSDAINMASTFDDLGHLASEKGQLDLAKDYHLRALAIYEKQAPTSTELADTLRRLGTVAQLAGDLVEAESRYRRSLAVLEKAVGPDHAQVAEILKSLAELLGDKGETLEALNDALRVEKIGRDHLRVVVRTLPEREGLLYAQARPVGLDLALTLSAQGKVPNLWPEVGDALVRSRAVVLDEMASRHHAVSGAEDPEIAQLAKKLTVARERLARWVYRGPGDDSPEVYRDRLERARKEKDRAEQTLAERSLPFREELAKTKEGLEEVARALPPGSALVAYARCIRHQPARRLRPGEPKPALSISYLASVLCFGTRQPAVSIPRQSRGLYHGWPLKGA